MTELSENILGKIKENHICPVPRWHFLLKNYVFWGFFGISVLLGSLSFGVIEHIFRCGDFDLIAQFQGNILTSTMILLPIFWLCFLGIFAYVAFYNWKHTRSGYRFKWRWIFVISLFLSFFFGNIFYLRGFGKNIDSMMNKALPLYSQTKHKARLDLWRQPSKGLMIGRITQINSQEQTLLVEDGYGNFWNVSNDVKNKTHSNLNQLVREGEIVKIIGVEDGNDNFVATDIRSCNDCDGNNDDYGGIDADQDED